MTGAVWNYCHLYTLYNQAACRITSCKATYVGRMCLAVTCQLHFGQNDQDLFHATAVTGGMDAEIRVSTESWPWRKQFSHHSCRDLNPQPFNHVFGTLTTEPFLFPSVCCWCVCNTHWPLTRTVPQLPTESVDTFKEQKKAFFSFLFFNKL